MVKDSPKVGYTEPLLSSSSLKSKGVLVNHDGGKFKRTRSSLYEALLAASLLLPLNMAPVCLFRSVGESICLLSQNHFHESSYSFESFKECLGHCRIMVWFQISSSQMLPSFVLFLTMFKGKFESNHHL